MRKFRGRRFPIRAIIFIVLGLILWATEAFRDKATPSENRGAAAIVEAFEDQRSGLVVEISGEVARVLPDDLQGSRHQRFVLRLTRDHTVLVSHNIDIADRIPLAAGDDVEVRGQYEWNERGGVIHWTHRDPQGRRPGGWIRHQGKTVR